MKCPVCGSYATQDGANLGMLYCFRCKDTRNIRTNIIDRTRNFATVAFKKLSTQASIGIIVSILALFVSLITLFYLDQQNKNLALTLDSATFQEMMTQQYEMHNKLIETINQEEGIDLYPYFYEGATIDKSHSRYALVRSIADLQLDVLDSLAGQARYLSDAQGIDLDKLAEEDEYFNSLKNDGGEYDDVSVLAWTTFIYDSFHKSPILCQRLAERRLWYAGWLMALAGEACDKGSGISILYPREDEYIQHLINPKPADKPCRVYVPVLVVAGD